jgi:hypothetical protein
MIPRSLPLVASLPIVFGCARPAPAEPLVVAPADPPPARSTSSADAGTSEPPPARPPPVASATREDRSCELPPADMLRDNFAATRISGIGEILTSGKTGLGGTTPAPSTGYINFRFEVRVVRWFVGSGPEKMVLIQGAEATSTPAAPGRFLFFSACTLPDGSGAEPDVGYFFPVEPECVGEAQTLGEASAKRARTAKGVRSVCTAPKKTK